MPARWRPPPPVSGGATTTVGCATNWPLRRTVIGRELAAAQEVVAGLPQALQDARVKQGRTKRPLVIVGVAALVLAGGGAAFAIVRRSARPTEPSPRPPSVEIDPKP